LLSIHGKGTTMKGRLAIIAILTVLYCRTLHASIVWDTGSPIHGGSIESPVEYGSYLGGAKVTFSVAIDGNDSDHWYDSSNCTGGTEVDEMSLPEWGASAGLFMYGDYIGEEVEWLAPNYYPYYIEVDMYEDDLPTSILSGESGTRDDDYILSDYKTYIQVCTPYLSTAEYGGGINSIDDVGTPEYSYISNSNGPASWVFDSNPTVDATFAGFSNLSQSVSGVKVRAQTYGDEGNIGNWGDSDTETWETYWSSPSMSCESEGTIDSSVQNKDYSAYWYYKCTNGSNTWISITDQTGCRLYVTYNSPKCSSLDYSKSHLYKATTYASGGYDQDSIVNTLQSYIHTNKNFYEGTGKDGQTGVWNIIDPGGSGNGGDCIAHANLMNLCLEVIGIEASYAYVADATNQPSESDPTLRWYYCQSHSRYEHKYFRMENNGQTWNFEGVCEVDGTYYDVSATTKSGTYNVLKTSPPNGIVFEWVYMYEDNNDWYECDTQGGTHTPL
jgi:hypothetical protein